MASRGDMKSGGLTLAAGESAEYALSGSEHSVGQENKNLSAVRRATRSPIS